MRVNQSTFESAIESVNNGSSWKDAAFSIGMSMDGLRHRAKKEGIVVRKGQMRIRTHQKFFPPQSSIDLCRIATLIDTEGHITIGSETANRTRVVLIGITNTHEPTIRWLESFGGKASLKKGGNLPCWTWQLQGRLDVIALLDAVIPFMHIKKDKAIRALELLHDWTGPTLQRIKDLNIV